MKLRRNFVIDQNFLLKNMTMRRRNPLKDVCLKNLSLDCALTRNLPLEDFIILIILIMNHAKNKIKTSHTYEKHIIAFLQISHIKAQPA